MQNINEIIQKMPLERQARIYSRAAQLIREATCPLCKVGHLPFKLKRRTVHHFPETGQLIVCKAAELRSNQI